MQKPARHPNGPSRKSTRQSDKPHGKSHHKSRRDLPKEAARRPAPSTTATSASATGKSPARSGQRRYQPIEAHASLPADQVMIYGRHPVLAALNNPKRRIKSLSVTPETLAWLKDEHSAVLASLPQPPFVTNRASLEESLPPQDKHVHQGIVMIANRLVPPQLEDWMDTHAQEQMVLLLLDQITDARNIGAIMRSALAFGASAIIATDRHAPEETGAMLRAASGAAEHMPLIRVVNLSRSIGWLQDHGFFVAGLDARGDGDIASLALEDRLAIVLGAEGSGLRHLTREKADRLIQIPMAEAAESLNVSNAAAVALYAVYAGRKQASPG